jgi:hypothetical protein
VYIACEIENETYLMKQLLNHDRNKNIQFLEDEHQYWYYPSGDKRKKSEAVQFDGITSWIGSFKERFDMDATAKACNKNPNSKYYKLGEDVIKQQWIDRRDEGSDIHKAIENCVNTGEIDPEYDFYITEYFREMDKWGLTPFQCEFVVYDENIKRATAIDDLATDSDGGLVIIDKKTYKDGMEFSSYKNKRYFAPLDDLYCSKYINVSIQNSIPSLWLQKYYGVTVVNHFVMVINDGGAELIPTLHLTDYVNKMYDYASSD